MAKTQRPIVMSLSGHDPSGGAGIQADIETLHTIGCHTSTVITCLTIQDTCNVTHLQPVDAEFIIQQAETILADMPIKVFKIGLIGNLENVEAIRHIISQHKNIPVILDPVLAAGGGKELSSKILSAAIVERLLSLTTLITPNIPEAQRLSRQTELEQCAIVLSQQGCEYSLITGTHSDSQSVINHLYDGQQLINEQEWPRLPYVYHGSGCTLATAIAAYVSLGNSIEIAVKKAQHFTWHSLSQASSLGKGQYIPLRMNHLSDDF